MKKDPIRKAIDEEISNAVVEAPVVTASVAAPIPAALLERYYIAVLQGILASDLPSRNPKKVAALAMRYAEAAVELRIEVLGAE